MIVYNENTEIRMSTKWNWKLMFCLNLIFEGTISASEALFRVPIIYRLWLEFLVFVPWTQNYKRKLK